MTIQATPAAPATSARPRVAAPKASPEGLAPAMPRDGYASKGVAMAPALATGAKAQGAPETGETVMNVAKVTVSAAVTAGIGAFVGSLGGAMLGCLFTSAVAMPAAFFNPLIVAVAVVGALSFGMMGGGFAMKHWWR